jgi:hypothetical protein
MAAEIHLFVDNRPLPDRALLPPVRDLSDDEIPFFFSSTRFPE